jgi:hypothetical protein
MKPTTYPHGTTLAPTTPGYDMTRRGLLVGRVHIRNAGRGRWVADVFAYDGHAWTLDRRTQPATLAETRAAIHEYAAAYDRRAYVTSGDCHA